MTPSFFVFGDFETNGGTAPFEKLCNYTEGFFGNDNAFKVRTYAGDDVLSSGTGYFTYPNPGGSYGYSGVVGGGGRFYKNGRLFGSGSSAAAGWPRSIGRTLAFASGAQWKGYAIYLFSIPLTNAQHALLHADPFGLLDFGTDPAAAFYASAGAAPGVINRRLRTLMGVGK